MNNNISPPNDNLDVFFILGQVDYGATLVVGGK